MFVVARRLALSLLCLSAATVCVSVARGQDANVCPEPRWHSEAWWRARAQDPVGARQVEFKGKQWPPYPHPVSPEQACWHIYHAEHYWPWPYKCTDREIVLGMSRTQEANGWLSETTLYDYHFNAESNELTVPGKLHLKWILEYVPSNYRTVWVQQVDDPALSQTRLNNVRATASHFVSQDKLPVIAFRPAMAPGRPAIEVDSIRRKELESIPSPRIAFEAGAGGAGGGAGGGSGSQNH